MYRYIKFFKRALRLSSFGDRYRDRLHIFFAYSILSVRRLIGLPYANRPCACAHIRFNGKTIPFYYRGLLDLYIFDGVFVEEEYETNLQDPPRVIFDLGSNTGATVLYFKLRYPNAKIFAFEPDPENIAVLRKNTAWFSEDVIVFEGAVSDTSAAAIDFYVGGEHWSSSLARRSVSDRRISVAMVTLDDAMKNFGIKTINLLKFDVEGAEYNIFKNFRGLAHTRHLVGEVHLDLFDSKVQDFWILFKDFRIERRPMHHQRLTAVFNRI